MFATLIVASFLCHYAYSAFKGALQSQVLKCGDAATDQFHGVDLNGHVFQIDISPASTKVVTFSTCNSRNNINSGLRLYDYPSATEIGVCVTPVAPSCANSCANGHSFAEIWNVTLDQSDYYIEIYSYEPGIYTVDMDCIPDPSNSQTNTPTTIAPTTYNPTTSVPTTTSPTTSIPTTYNPTTNQPTTSIPTTANPTTTYPTTYSPTTYQPTASNPTTALPTTYQPTTTIPTKNPISDGEVDNTIDNTFGTGDAFNNGNNATNSLTTILIIIIICLIFVILFMCLIYFIKKKKTQKEKAINEIEISNISPGDSTTANTKDGNVTDQALTMLRIASISSNTGETETQLTHGMSNEIVKKMIGMSNESHESDDEDDGMYQTGNKFKTPGNNTPNSPGSVAVPGSPSTFIMTPGSKPIPAIGSSQSVDLMELNHNNGEQGGILYDQEKQN